MLAAVNRISRPLVLLVVVACVLVGCAAPAGRSGHGQTEGGGSHLADGRKAAWLLKDLAQIPVPKVLLLAENLPAGVIETAPMRTAWSAAERLLQVAGGKAPEVVVITGRPANAFASVQDGTALVAINFGMVEMLGEDRDAWAALLGHEFSHLTLNHRESRQKRRADEEISSGLLGIALSIAGVPFGGTLADASVTLVERGYSRDEEREADRAGVDLMVRAGFDPAGAVRMQEKLARFGATAALPFLSTHPGGEERVEAMRELVRKYSVNKDKQE